MKSVNSLTGSGFWQLASTSPENPALMRMTLQIMQDGS